MIYFDTAYLAKCYLNEPGCAEVRALALASSGVASCRLGCTELTSVFHRHLREGIISRHTFNVIWTQFETDEVQGLWHWLPIPDSLLEAASGAFKSLDPKLFVRASDSIHLLCAATNGFREVFTNDRHMLSAAGAYGVTGKNIL